MLDVEDLMPNYTIPSDNWEQQHSGERKYVQPIIPYQAITGNNNLRTEKNGRSLIIPYQAITGNNNNLVITHG